MALISGAANLVPNHTFGHKNNASMAAITNVAKSARFWRLLALVSRTDSQQPKNQLISFSANIKIGFRLNLFYLLLQIKHFNTISFMLTMYCNLSA